MKTVKVFFEGVFLIGLMLFALITFLCLCLDGMCVREWLPRNVVMCVILEFVLFGWLIYHIKLGEKTIKEKTDNRNCVYSFYKRVLALSIFGIVFGLVMLLSYYGVFISFFNNKFGCFIYSCNILLLASLILVWMSVEMHKINRLQKKNKWVYKGRNKKIGYQFLVTYF